MHTETKKIVKTKDEVIRLLKKYPAYRDNDERLIATFWYCELKRKDFYIENLTAMDLLEIYSKNKVLTAADCIVRTRAKVQQDNPELRGLTWKARHGDGEEVTKEIVHVHLNEEEE